VYDAIIVIPLRIACLPIFLGVAVFAYPSAQRTRPNYKKIEYMIPMRDGVKLFVAVYTPVDKPGKHPILMERTPYSAGPYGPDDRRGGFRGSDKFTDAGYIFAFADVRGHYMSEGDYVNVRPELHRGQKGIDESTDTYDTVDYLVKNVPDNNGSVGLWGISYPGFYAGVGAIHTHPALKAVSPQAPVSNWFIGDDFHHNGAFFVQDAFDFLTFFGPVRTGPAPRLPQGPQFDRGEDGAYSFFLKTGALPNFDKNYYKGAIPFWNDMMAHPTYDRWWQDRSLPDHMDDVHCAVMVVGGLFDAEDMWGALNLYQATKKRNPSTPVFLTMGPWYHGMWASRQGTTFGDLNFGQNTSTWFQDNVEFPFFDKYLRGENLPTPPAATIFETGANVWKTFPVWPPKGLGKVSYYPDSAGALSTSPSSGGSESYVYDPANPTPYLANPKTPRRTREYMIDDQRWAEKRSDVLTYKTAPFATDQTVAGPVDVNLWVSTTGTDSDFVVKVIDVWPDDSTEESSRHVSMAGYEQELRADIFRGKFRDSYSRPKPFEPGKPTLVHFHLNDVLHDFKPGHRLMLQIQSSWFPLVDRNPNKFEDINQAQDADFQPATITLYHDAAHPTRLTFGTLP
jgi:putative CocE/NonD family hydrolase